MDEVKIGIESLYKIFGPRAQSVLAEVQRGMSKQELLERHNHVLGLRDINVDVTPREISVIMGLSGSGKSTLIRHINRLIDPTSGRIVVDGHDVLAMTKEELIEFDATRFRWYSSGSDCMCTRPLRRTPHTASRSRERPFGRPSSRAGNGWNGSAFRDSRTTTRHSFRAECSSESDSPGPSPPTRRSC